MQRKHHPLFKGVSVIKQSPKSRGISVTWSTTKDSFPSPPPTSCLSDQILSEKCENKKQIKPVSTQKGITEPCGQNITFGIVLKRPGPHQVPAVGHLATYETDY